MKNVTCIIKTKQRATRRLTIASLGTVRKCYVLVDNKLLRNDYSNVSAECF